MVCIEGSVDGERKRSPRQGKERRVQEGCRCETPPQYNEEEGQQERVVKTASLETANKFASMLDEINKIATDTAWPLP